MGDKITEEFSGLWAIRSSKIAIQGDSYYLCRCGCGQIKFLPAKAVENRRAKRCPRCLARMTNNHRHTMPEYRSWCAMKHRCNNPKATDYDRYGGRGIQVCLQWNALHGFAQFYFDMGPKPSPEFTIERVDNMGDYRPGNCRWATRIEQQRNMRYNRLLTVRGVTLCAVEWAERPGAVSAKLMCERSRAGWDDERAIYLPSRKREAV